METWAQDEELYLFDLPEDFLKDFNLPSSNGTDPSNFKYNRSEELSKYLSQEYLPKKEFEIISAMRYDPTIGDTDESRFLLLKLHQQRLQYSIDFFQWDVEITYDHLLKELLLVFESLDNTKPYKIRISVAKSGQLKIEASEVPVRSNIFSGLLRTQLPSDPIYTVHLDTESMMVSPFTSFKTTNRDHYTQSRERCIIPVSEGGSPFQEVLLYNTRNEVTEGTITSVALFRNGAWRTPPLGVGCLCGVMRAHLLSKKAIQEATIDRKSLREGEPVLIFNGVMGVCRGILKLR